MKVSEKIVSAYEVCVGEVRWRQDGLLEQLWRINHVGTTDAVDKTSEEWEWRLVPEGCHIEFKEDAGCCVISEQLEPDKQKMRAPGEYGESTS